MCRLSYNRWPKGVELVVRLEIRAYYCRAYYGSPQLFLLGSRWTNKKGLKNFWDEQNGHKQTDKRTDRWDEQKMSKQTDRRTDPLTRRLLYRC